MRRPSYRDALRWLVMNDDCNWLDYPADDGMGSMSVSAALAADMFDVGDDRIRADLIKAFAKHRGKR